MGVRLISAIVTIIGNRYKMIVLGFTFNIRQTPFLVSCGSRRWCTHLGKQLHTPRQVRFMKLFSQVSALLTHVQNCLIAKIGYPSHLFQQQSELPSLLLQGSDCRSRWLSWPWLRGPTGQTYRACWVMLCLPAPALHSPR